MIVLYIVITILAYLLGSISFSVIISKKMAGFDVREKGSGNAGSTNVLRTVGKKAAMVGNMPGVTKNLNWIKINNDIDLLDSPGILWPKFDDEEIALNLAATSAIKEEILNISDIAIHILNKLNDYYIDKLKERYGINYINKENYEETLEQIGRKRGCVLKGNIIDYEKVYSIILKDIKDANIKGITFDRYNKSSN